MWVCIYGEWVNETSSCEAGCDCDPPEGPCTDGWYDWTDCFGTPL